MRNIDEVLNAIVEEGFTTTVFFIPILLVVLGLFNVLGLSLISGFFLSVAIATAIFFVRIYLRLGGRVISKRSVKEAVLVGLISSIPHLAYVAFLVVDKRISKLSSSNARIFRLSNVALLQELGRRGLHGESCEVVCIMVDFQFNAWHNLRFDERGRFKSDGMVFLLDRICNSSYLFET